jgi:hypothetical protein
LSLEHENNLSLRSAKLRKEKETNKLITILLKKVVISLREKRNPRGINNGTMVQDGKRLHEHF